MPHKPPLGKPRCRMNALSPKSDAACMPDDASTILSYEGLLDLEGPELVVEWRDGLPGRIC